MMKVLTSVEIEKRNKAIFSNTFGTEQYIKITHGSSEMNPVRLQINTACVSSLIIRVHVILCVIFQHPGSEFFG